MKVNINEIQSNVKNPRFIKDSKFKKLVQSIKDFPQMLELRPIVIDENNLILGGNMRHKACIEAGLKEVHVKVAKGLTVEQKQEFIIKDNVSFGEWEWDILGNEWNSVEISKWGLDVWQNEDDAEIQDIEQITEFTENVNFIIRCDNLQQLDILKNRLNTQATKLTYEDFIKKIA
tara:strand:+ start:2068 stop:2592 length:525 start_codon:yes stop_codon:yes gene_type:complete